MYIKTIAILVLIFVFPNNLQSNTSNLSEKINCILPYLEGNETNIVLINETEVALIISYYDECGDKKYKVIAKIIKKLIPATLNVACLLTVKNPAACTAITAAVTVLIEADELNNNVIEEGITNSIKWVVKLVDGKTPSVTIITDNYRDANSAYLIFKNQKRCYDENKKNNNEGGIGWSWIDIPDDCKKLNIQMGIVAKYFSEKYSGALYVGENIPLKKSRNIKEACSISEREDLIAMIDVTSRVYSMSGKGGSYGMAITKNGIYWKSNCSDNCQSFLSWADMEYTTLSHKTGEVEFDYSNSKKPKHKTLYFKTGWSGIKAYEVVGLLEELHFVYQLNPKMVTSGTTTVTNKKKKRKIIFPPIQY